METSTLYTIVYSKKIKSISIHYDTIFKNEDVFYRTLFLNEMFQHEYIFERY